MSDTLVELFETQVQRLGVRSALQYYHDGEWEELTWKEWWDASERLAAGLIEQGVGPNERVGLMASTRREWVVADMAIAMAGAVSVAIDPAMTVRELTRVVDQTGLETLVVEHPLHVSRVVELVRQGQPIHSLIYMDGHLHTAREGRVGGDLIRIEEVAVPPKMEVWPLAEAMQRGRRALSGEPRYVASRRRSLEGTREATVVFTSGVSDRPEGVRLSHANLVAQIEGLSALQLFGNEEKQLLTLPLAQIFGRLMYLAALGYGMTTAFGRGPAYMRADLEETSPTLMACVPKLVERLRAVITDRLKQRGMRGAWLVDALDSDEEGRWQRFKRRRLADSFSDDVQRWMGGQMAHLICGGAPLARREHRFFEAFDYRVLEGYGLTESAGGVSFNMPDDFRVGSVGKPLPGADVTIAEDGEVLVRGEMVMMGYLGGDVDEARGVDEAGWLHTGDVGEFDSDGFLYLRDRKTELIVTSTGRHVATQGLEKALAEHPLVAQAVVVGEGRPYLGAMIGLEADELLSFVKEQRLDEGQSVEALTQHRRVRAAVREHVERINRQRNRRERVRQFGILPQFLSVQQRTLTPSGTVRRREVMERYADEIEALFEGEPTVQESPERKN